MAELTYLNFVVGVLIMLAFLPIQDWCYRKELRRRGVKFFPEARFYTSLFTVWLVPGSLLWFCFTCEGDISYWSPIIAGTILGFADPLLWLAMLQYVTGMSLRPCNYSN